MDVFLSDFDVVEPDLLFIASEHTSIITEKHIMGVRSPRRFYQI